MKNLRLAFLVAVSSMPLAASAQVMQPPGMSTNDAQLEVRLSAMEEALKNLRGRLEESEFQSRKNAEALDKLQRDVEFRFNQQNLPPPTVVAGTNPPTPTNTAPGAPHPVATSTDTPAPAQAPDTSGQTTAGDGVLRMPDSTAPADGNFSTPREHYNYAFRLLNQTQYEAAAAAFTAFTQKYPKDPLVGNAYYWEGETYYIRRDYVKAADNFRQGFEALPEGPKAADNLLKLAMSLDALNRDKEACVVLTQVVTKFKKSSTSVTDKATQEQKRIGCKG